MQSTEFDSLLGGPHASSSGKTFPVSSPSRITRSAASLLVLPAKMMSSSQQGRNGQTLVLCLDPKGQSHGGPSTPNFSDWPNDAVVCSLSQVLVRDSIPQQYFLSSKACAGILRRAEKRGKVLPIPLHRALSAVAAASSEPETPEDKTPLSQSFVPDMDYQCWKCHETNSMKHDWPHCDWCGEDQREAFGDLLG